MANIVGKAKDVAKKTVNGAKKAVKGVKKAAKFINFCITNPIGNVIGVIILVVVITVILYVAIKTVRHAIGIFFDDNYAGIATDGDYDTLIGSLGYAGYDSFIPEEKLKEYAAFEYTVLMDVAEYLYDNQDYVYTKTTQNRYGESEDFRVSAAITDIEDVYSGYDDTKMTEDEWKKAFIEGQDGAEYAVSNGSSVTYFGGNRDVVSPRLIYEVAGNEYEQNAVSYKPYLVIVREDLELSYYFTGLKEGYIATHRGEVNAEEGISEDVLDAIRVSPELNRFNTHLPMSSYQKELASAVSNKEITGVEDPASYVKADRYDYSITRDGKSVNNYGEVIYYTTDENDIVYKIPLELLINRYLPKATLLTSWYMLKDDGNDSNFDLDGLMQKIKDIYISACLNKTSSEIESITVDGEIDDDGNIVACSTSAPRLRAGEDKASCQTNEGNTYATTNKDTFIYFEKFGAEISRYEKLKVYAGPYLDETDLEDITETENNEALPDAEAPSANYLTREKVNFVKSMNVTIKNVEYESGEGENKTIEITDVELNLKPSYDIEEDELLDEKLKSQYIYGVNVPISSEAPYNFMKEVVKIVNNEMNSAGAISQKDKSNKDDDKAMVYDHLVANQYYILAEPIIKDNDTTKDTNEKNSQDVDYKLVEDFSYYNQDKQMPYWYDLSGDVLQGKLEDTFISAFKDIYSTEAHEDEIKIAIAKELGISPDAIRDLPSVQNVNYTYNDSATLYNDNVNHVTSKEKIESARSGKYKLNYYWKALYTIKVNKLQMKEVVHHTRMPIVLVKSCDFWAKSVSFTNTIKQNQLNYKNYRCIIPNSINFLGLSNISIEEKSKYRVNDFKEFYNKFGNSGDNLTDGLKEADILNMLVQWEDYASRTGDEAPYAYMRELYKLTIAVRDLGQQMLSSAYSYLYVPSTIINYSDATIQKEFWLNRLAASKGEDELTDEEEDFIRLKGVETKWQNVEYDEYEECVYDLGDGGEDARVYALFPYSAPVVRTYFMLKSWNEACPYGYTASHNALDLYSRAYAKEILNSKEKETDSSDEAKSIYFYELNRLTISKMLEWHNENDAFLLAEKELDETLEGYTLYSPIVSIAPGRVTHVDYDARSGFKVEIDHSPSGEAGKIVSVYCHMKRWPLVSVNEVVGAGTVIGYEGTTGRSTGNHLHFEINIQGKSEDTKNYIMPIFSPFNYKEKAEAILEEANDNKLLGEGSALGTEYYRLIRTVLPDFGLFNECDVIDGKTMTNGQVIDNTHQENRTEAYKFDEKYEDGAYSNDVVWGNNVPKTPIANSLEEIFDRDYLNVDVGYDIDFSGEQIAGATNELNIQLVSSSSYFNISGDKLTLPRWYVAEIADSQSRYSIPFYNGPKSVGEEVSNDEAISDLKSLQESLRDKFYYIKAGEGYSFDDVDYGEYSTEFSEIVSTLQKDLNSLYGYENVTSNGNIDLNTLAAYNSSLNYYTFENQKNLGEKVVYNETTNLSSEGALLKALASCLNANNVLNETSGGGSIPVNYSGYYGDYEKKFNKKIGLFAISSQLAVAKLAEDGIDKNDAMIEIRKPTVNVKVASELIKEYARRCVYNKEFAQAICNAKWKALNNGSDVANYWKDVCEKSKKYSTRWIDGENIDRLMIYAVAIKAYEDNADSTDDEYFEQVIENVIQSGPTGLANNVFNIFKNLILESK